MGDSVTEQSSSRVRRPKGRVAVLMGVSGSGKTTVGRKVARRLGWEFVEGDDFHSAEALKKMSSGAALDDSDRESWLARLAAEIRAHVASGTDTVLACSALKERYRRTLAGGGPGDVVFVFLRAGREVLERRLEARRGHFFRPELLASQLEALEEPRDAVLVDASGSPARIAEAVVRALGSSRKTVKIA
jgi:gluconokinase